MCSVVDKSSLLLSTKCPTVQKEVFPTRACHWIHAFSQSFLQDGTGRS